MQTFMNLQRFIISLVSVLSGIEANTCHLKCVSCDPAPSKAFQTVMSALVKVPDKQVCVWNSGDREVEHERLVKFLVSSYKIVTSFKKNQVDAVPPLCKHNILLTNGSRCRELLAPSLPLTADHHFYVLFSGHLAKDLASCSEQFGIARAAFVSLEDTRVFALSSPLFLPRIFKVSDLVSLSKKETFTHVNLKGRPVSIASFNCPPFVVIPDENDTDSITGIEWEVIKSMARVMNFTVKLAELKGDRRWGYLLNGSWTGGIALAMHEETAEIGACNMWYTSSTYRIMNFGHPLNVIKFTFIVPRPKPLLQNWRALVKVFDDRVWILIVYTYFFYTVCYWSLLLSTVHANRGAKPGLVKVSLSVFGMLMGTAYPTHAAPGSTRQVVTWWCVFVLLLTSTYNTSIASRLTLQGYEQRIDTIRHLVQRGLHWTDHPSHSPERRSTYFNRANRWQKEWEKRYLYTPSESMKQAVDSGKFAFPIQRWGEHLMFLTVRGLDVDRDLDGMRVVKETTTLTFPSIQFAKRSPLYQACQIALLRVTEAGLVTYWSTLVSRAPQQKFARRLLQEDEGRADAKKLSLANVWLVYFMLIVGLSASLVVFIIEIFCKWGKVKRLLRFCFPSFTDLVTTLF